LSAAENFVTRLIILTAILLSLHACGEQQPGETLRFDIVIENGLVLDGSGSDAIETDVFIHAGEIVRIDELDVIAASNQVEIGRRIDADGRIVAPGFIDVHSHGDPLQTPDFENFLAQGVTTITLGQDGSSPASENLSEWMNEVEAQGIGVNLAMFVGHGTLRELSGIGRDPVPSPEQLQRMLEMLEHNLEVSFGMSAGLEYNPGLNAAETELLALAEVVGRHDRVIMSHMRNEDDDAIEASLAELLAQGEYARVHVAHMKSVYGRGAARAEELLALMQEARDRGYQITADVYPYNASYTGIGIVFPVWAKTQEQFDEALPARREELAEYLRNRVNLRNGPDATLLGTDPYTGKTLADLEQEMNMPFEDILIDIIGPQGASGAYFVMNDELQSRLLEDAYVGVSSDGSPTGFHPRGHGTFAKIIEEYVVKRESLALSEAVRKMTSFAADILGITDRGRVEVGQAADLIVFDPAAVRARATYPEPHELASGFELVLVNGEIAFKDGAGQPQRNGAVLRP
jgi:N-acyl-D-aspartate/D-glutamate deacylase